MVKGWWFTFLRILSREYHLEVQLKKKISSRTNRQTCRENLTNETQTHLGILQQFSTMILPMVFLKRTNIYGSQGWFKIHIKDRNHLREFQEHPCHTVDFCRTTYLGNLLLQGPEHKSQIVCSFRISEPSPVCIQSISICQNLDQFLKVKHLARHM